MLFFIGSHERNVVEKPTASPISSPVRPECHRVEPGRTADCRIGVAIFIAATAPLKHEVDEEISVGGEVAFFRIDAAAEPGTICEHIAILAARFPKNEVVPGTGSATDDDGDRFVAGGDNKQLTLGSLHGRF